MSANLDCVNRLINCFTNLPGVGYKTAERYAYKIIESDPNFVTEFCTAMTDAKKRVRFCEICGNFSTENTCNICKKRRTFGVNSDTFGANSDTFRGKSDTFGGVICVVRDPRDVIAIEKSGAFGGTYHVLHGVISPLDRKTPDDLNIKSLLTRIRDEKPAEIIIATNPDVEGEATAHYLAALLRPLGVKTTRIAQGLAAGSNLEYADQTSLSTAINNRTTL